MMNKVKKCQEILLQWMCIKDSVSYQVIAKKCEYLNIQFELNLERHPIRTIFFPLLMSGNVEFCDGTTFKVTPPLCIQYKGNYLYINIIKTQNEDETGFTFLFKSKSKASLSSVIKYYDFNVISVLRSFPKIDKVVNSFNVLGENDFSSLVFANPKDNFGVAKKDALFTNWFFVYPHTRKICSIPNWIKQPDALNVSYCFYRALSGKYNGKYNKENKILKVKQFHFPILLYRVLLLESLLNNGIPYSKNSEYIFPNIKNSVIIELNRIMCKSINYE